MVSNQKECNYEGEGGSIIENTLRSPVLIFCISKLSEAYCISSDYAPHSTVADNDLQYLSTTTLKTRIKIVIVAFIQILAD